MVIEFEQEYLEELYEDGKCKNKKYRFQPQVVGKYQKRIDTLIGATRLEDLFVLNSLNVEAIDSANNIFSIRVDYHYRLIFSIKTEGPEPVVTIANIIDLTNHYK